jgi:uncharacterized membrane protein YhaH (DUF805 family)
VTPLTPPKKSLKLLHKKRQQYMVTSGGETLGPYDSSQIKAYVDQGHLSLDDRAAALGRSEWRSLKEVLSNSEVPESLMPAYSPRTFTPKRRYPGMARLPYFLSSFGLAVIFEIISAIFLQESSLGYVLVVGLMQSVIGFMIALQRLQNIGMSGWSLLMLLVPILNVVYYVRLAALPPGYEEHKELDAAAIVIMWIAYGFIGLALIFVIIAAL